MDRFSKNFFFEIEYKGKTIALHVVATIKDVGLAEDAKVKFEPVRRRRVNNNDKVFETF